MEFDVYSLAKKYEQSGQSDFTIETQRVLALLTAGVNVRQVHDASSSTQDFFCGNSLVRYFRAEGYSIEEPSGCKLFNRGEISCKVITPRGVQPEIVKDISAVLRVASKKNEFVDGREVETFLTYD
jgi:hypothetical protein